jgi:hypothetical protein
MMNFLKIIANKACLLALMSMLFACKGTEKTPEPGTPFITLKLFHTFNGERFRLNQAYRTENGDTIVANKLAYYLSNFKIFDAGGTINERVYRLIRFQANTDTVVYNCEILSALANGQNQIEWGIGVDNAANNSLDNFGDLSPTNNDMYWSWNTGYKFVLLEGKVRRNGVEKNLVYHIGLNQGYKLFRATLPYSLQSDRKYNMVFEVKLDELFKNPNTIDVLAENDIQFDPVQLKKIADNYGNGFLNLR